MRMKDERKSRDNNQRERQNRCIMSGLRGQHLRSVAKVSTSSANGIKIERVRHEMLSVR